MKLSNYIAYDNTLMMMPNSLGQGHVKKYPANIDLVQRKRKGNTENDQGV